MSFVRAGCSLEKDEMLLCASRDQMAQAIPGIPDLNIIDSEVC
jgi:hypothetical protein